MSVSAALSYRWMRLSVSFRNLLLLFERPWVAFALAGIYYLALSASAGAPWRVTDRAYYNYLADAFLHGQLALRLVPPSTLDLSLYHGQYFLYWGPLPALFAMPLVALWGVSASDILQGVFFGALNAGLLASLLRRADQRGVIALSPLRRALLVIFFFAGTSIAPLPAAGNVWYLLSVEAFTFTLLAYLAAFSFEGGKAFFWTGCAMAGVLLTRPSAVFIGVFLVWYLLRRSWPSLGGLQWRAFLTRCALGLLPVLLAGGLTLVYNALRFGSPLDNGLNYHQMNPAFRADFVRYGAFNLYYLGMNIYYTYLNYPLATLFTQGYVQALGGSLFLLSPLFFAALYALWQDRRNPDTWFLLLCVLLGNAPQMILMGPGFMFGPRYTLDFTTPLLLLTALGMRRWRPGLVLLLVALSVLQYFIGALMFAHGVLNI